MPIASKWLGREAKDIPEWMGRFKVVWWKVSNCPLPASGWGGRQRRCQSGWVDSGCVVEGIELPIASKWLGREAKDMPEWIGRFKVVWWKVELPIASKWLGREANDMPGWMG